MLYFLLKSFVLYLFLFLLVHKLINKINCDLILLEIELQLIHRLKQERACCPVAKTMYQNNFGQPRIVSKVTKFDVECSFKLSKLTECYKLFRSYYIEWLGYIPVTGRKVLTWSADPVVINCLCSCRASTLPRRRWDTHFY